MMGAEDLRVGKIDEKTSSTVTTAIRRLIHHDEKSTVGRTNGTRTTRGHTATHRTVVA
jgi:hypothetical protein